MQGEALRQVLVNRYYGTVRAAGRRESLTAFGNGPLAAGGPGKAATAGRTHSAPPGLPPLGTGWWCSQGSQDEGVLGGLPLRVTLRYVSLFS